VDVLVPPVFVSVDVPPELVSVFVSEPPSPPFSSVWVYEPVEDVEPPLESIVEVSEGYSSSTPGTMVSVEDEQAKREMFSAKMVVSRILFFICFFLSKKQ
jgi:hypothetical protein